MKTLRWFAAASLLWLPLAVGADSKFDGRYSGRITCDAIPGQTSVPLNTAFVMTVREGKAEYQREIIQPDSQRPLGITERGLSMVSPEGELSLKGGASGPTWSYEASYAGKLEGKAGQLNGQQVWRFQGKPVQTRPCSVAVRLSQ